MSIAGVFALLLVLLTVTSFSSDFIQLHCMLCLLLLLVLLSVSVIVNKFITDWQSLFVLWVIFDEFYPVCLRETCVRFTWWKLVLCTVPWLQKGIGSYRYLRKDYWPKWNQVPEERLLTKMESYGIDAKVHRGIKDFSVNRKNTELTDTDTVIVIFLHELS